MPRRVVMSLLAAAVLALGAGCVGMDDDERPEEATGDGATDDRTIEVRGVTYACDVGFANESVDPSASCARYEVASGAAGDTAPADWPTDIEADGERYRCVEWAGDEDALPEGMCAAYAISEDIPAVPLP